MRFLLLFLCVNLYSQEASFFISKCVLSGKIGCEELVNNIASKINQVNESDALFKLDIYKDLTNPNINTIIYISDLKSEKLGVNYSINRIYKATATSDYILNDFGRAIIYWLDTYLAQDEDATGKIAITPFFSKPGIFSNYRSSQGSSRFNIDYGGDLSYHTDKWKGVLSLGGRYDSSSNPATATSEGADIVNNVFRYGVDVIRSLDKNPRFSAMLSYFRRKVHFQHSPTDSLPVEALENVATKDVYQIAMEWVRNPFLEKSDGNISIQTRFRKEDHQYLDPITFENRNDTFYIGKLYIGVDQHFKNQYIVGGSVSAYYDFKEGLHKGVNFRLRANLPLFQRFSLAPSVRFGFTQNDILSPAQSGARFINLTGATNQPFSMSGNISMSYTFGNAALRNQDRRWR